MSDHANTLLNSTGGSPTDSASDFYVVGVGASAGGLEALERMFDAMPADTGMAFVIVQHLSPDFKSLMDELLSRHTRMAIHRVEDGIVVEPNSLYLIPPRQEMIIADGKLLLKEKENTNSLSLPIDHFFRSLAQDKGRSSIGVILSGTGSDGSRGLKDIHEVGGLVISQSIENAKFDGMPRSAIDTGFVDVVVPANEIPDVLGRYSVHPIPSQLAKVPVGESDIEHIFRLLQERHRIDFSHYKPTTIGRRIERRIQLNHYGNLDEYVKLLEDTPDEVDQLYKDLLIGVTRFFRDSRAFEFLQQEILPQLLASQDTNEEFRVWVAACATGEEAYSLAILIDECMKELGRSASVKIFATDIHQASLDFAHQGLYPEASMAEMDEFRRDKYFVRTDAGYRVVPAIRRMIVFAPHNLVRDAPFTRLHLVTCRNLLIYLKPQAQKKVLTLFHFGLKAEGIVFLGASESPGELSDEFTTLDERLKFFRKRRNVRLSPDLQPPISVQSDGWRAPVLAARSTSPGLMQSGRDLLTTYNELLAQYMPPAILVNESREVLHIFGGAGRYLEHHDGLMTTSLVEMAGADLKMAVLGALQRVAKSEKPVSYPRVRLKTADGEEIVRLDVSPVRSRGVSPRYLIAFEVLKQPQIPDTPIESLKLDNVSKDHLHELERELRFAREHLQTTIEELETSNEELQATNEELVASNEELQSTNEELHSVNEELYTVNAEYQNKISELTELTNDMDNLLLSTDVHTLFLDEKMCIRRFTPRIADVFNLVPHDIGRRIGAFSHSITCDELTSTVRDVLSTGQPHEERVQDGKGRHFLMRVLPYRASDCIGGVVLTLIDISSLVIAQKTVHDEQERFKRAVAANRDGTWDWTNVDTDEMWWSDNCYTLLGYEPGEFPALHSRWVALIHPEDRERVRETSVPDSDRCYVDLHRDFEYRMLHKSGEYRWFRHRAIVDHDAEGKPFRMTGSVGDIHDRKRSEIQKVDDIRRRDNFLAMLSHELRNPMGAILNAVEYFKASQKSQPAGNGNGSTKVDDETGNITQIIERQTRHMSRLLDDLLDVSRFLHHKVDFRKDVTDLVTLADAVVEAIDHEVRTRKHTLHTDIHAENLYVFGDATRLRQAQVNLLSNAAKYTSPHGKISYKLYRDNHDAVISVTDNGQGISHDRLSSIFDLFVQSDETFARSTEGMGVGLSLVRTIVDSHNGTITANSDGDGKGSTFEIRLPLTQRSPEPGPDHREFSPKGCRLLLVEDHDDARIMLGKTLELNGFEVRLAADGQAGLQEFSDFQPDVAVIDIGLPLINGLELAKEIRNLDEGRSTVLIALTGYGQKSDREAVEVAGFDAHLIKPLNPPDLFIKIARLRASKRAKNSTNST